MSSAMQLMMSVQPGDLVADLVAMHDRVCDLRFVTCEADLRVIAARALRRAFLAELLAAWQAGRLSEGQAAELVGLRADVVGLREIVDAVAGRAETWWRMHRETAKPLMIPPPVGTD